MMQAGIHRVRRVTSAAVAVGLVLGVSVVGSHAVNATVSSTPDASAGAADSSDPFDVFVLVPQSGGLADYGYAFTNSLEVAADELNAAGGILGRAVELSFVDSQGDATQAVTALQERLSEGDAPDLVWASVTSSEALAILPTLTEQKIPTLGIQAAAAVANPADYPYYFSGSADATLFPQFVAAEMERQGFEKIAVLAGNDAVGESVADAYSTVLTDAGMEVVTESYSPDDIDMTAPLQRLQDADPDVLIFSGLGAAPGYILDSRSKVGMTLPTYADQSLSTDIGSLVDPGDLEGVRLLTWKFNIVPDEPTPTYTAFLDAMRAKGEIKGVFILNAWPHDMLHAAAIGFEQAGSTDADAFRAAMEDLQWPAESPTVTFDSYSFSDTSHFNGAATIDDYGAASLAPWDDGRYLPAD
jgi:ABC-type branched-subunit amino acid transport system substrate-binding protein